MEKRRGFAVCILVEGPQEKTVLVMDSSKKPSYWKLPGGKSESGETPEHGALRELKEETGLSVRNGNLVQLLKIDRGDHDLYLYKATVKNFDGLKKKGDEGEDVDIFNISQIPTMEDFFLPHRKHLEKAGVLDAE